MLARSGIFCMVGHKERPRRGLVSCGYCKWREGTYRVIDVWTQGYEIIPQNLTPQLVAFCLPSIRHPRSRRHLWVSSRIQQAFTYALEEPLPGD